MSSFNFSRLVKKYSKHPAYLLRESGGYYDQNNGGIYKPGEVAEVQLETVAILPLSSQDLSQNLQFDEGGTYSIEDRKMYCYEKIEKGEKVKHKDDEYTVMSRKDYSDYDDGLFIYFLKRVDRK